MGLAWQQGPLAPRAAGRFLVPGPLQGRLLYAEPLRRRMRVRFGGAWIAASPAIGPLPGIYVPPPSSQPTAPGPLLCAAARAGSWVVRHMVDDPLLTGGTAYVREVMLAAGRAADGMIASSRRRLLARTCARVTARELRWRWKGTSGPCCVCGASRCPAARRSQARW